MINKHIRPVPGTHLRKSTKGSARSIKDNTKLINVFDTNHSVNIQRVIISEGIDETFFTNIELGNFDTVTADQIEGFLSVCPKPAEITRLYKAISDVGLEDFQSALTLLDCGKVERFMLNLLVNWPDLERKATIILHIHKV